MPHLTLEYSANLDGKVDIAGLCKALRDTILATGVFEVGAVRVRAVRCDHYAIADLMPENAFVDLNFRVGTGRSLEDRKRVGEALFSVAQETLADLLGSPHFALSLEIREIDPELSWRRNMMHARLRNTKD